MVGYYIGPYPRVLLQSSAGFEAIMNNVDYSNKGTQIYPILTPFLGEGLVTSNGGKWHARRKLLTPTFHFKILQDFIGVMNEQSNVLVHDVLMSKDLSRAVDICPLVTRAALDIICEAAMGKKMGSQLDPKAAYPVANLELSDIITIRGVN